MNEEHIAISVLEDIGAVITGHFVYRSGKHGMMYLNKDIVSVYLDELSLLCRSVSGHFASADVEVVVAPAVGGVALSQMVAVHLNGMGSRRVYSIYAEKCHGEHDEPLVIKHRFHTFRFRSAHRSLIAGRKVLVVEDVLTTGGSARKVVSLVRAHGGDVVGLGAILNRGKVTAQVVGVPELYAVITMKSDQWDMWDAEECPLCRQDVPVNTDVGYGQEFLSSR